ncbi:MAG: hypothetical protein RBS39_05815 [Phycisphaerales bacterium]|jgi:hypothetical protein|nr:hypothetical protein [Phycisphaerales bacterium]
MSEHNDAKTTSRVGSAALWASAVVLCGLILTQASSLGTSTAQAGLVSQVSELTALTVRSGAEDLLLVLDNRTEELYVYQIGSKGNSVELIDKESVSQMFTNARTNKTGG